MTVIMAAWSVFRASRVARFILAAGAIALAVLTFGAMQRRKGREDLRADQLEDRVEREERGRAAAAAVQRESAEWTPQEQLDHIRGNDGRWE